MKRFLFAVAVFVALSTSKSFAESIKLVSTTAYSSNGVAVYPYNFSVNGSSSTSQFMCIDYNLKVSVGETWNVAAKTLSSATDQASINYRAAAYLFSQMGTDAKTNVALQYAAWSLFQSNAEQSSAWTTAAANFVTTAKQMAQNASLINSGFFSKFLLYVPLTDPASMASWTNGLPQSYIALAPTPEPSALLLMGTGLLGTVGVMRRRKNACTKVQVS